MQTNHSGIYISESTFCIIFSFSDKEQAVAVAPAIKVADIFKESRRVIFFIGLDAFINKKMNDENSG